MKEGTALYEEIPVTAHRAVCQKCGNSWVTLAKRKPKRCSAHRCRSWEWDGPKRAYRVNEIKLPAVRGRGRPKKSGAGTALFRIGDDLEFSSEP